MSMNNLEHETFRDFFDNWLSEQNQHLRDLRSAANANNDNNNNNVAYENEVVDVLIKRVMEHYEKYYKVKSDWIERNVLEMLNPSWISSLEGAFQWLGGWRPSMAFHLLYSKSGLQLEDHLVDFIRGVPTGDLADLSSDQLVKIDGLQRVTIKKERETTEKMAKIQETIADPSMVELSHVVTKSQMGRGDSSNEGLIMDELKAALGRKEEDLKEILNMADELRLQTLNQIVEILTHPQTVHFLIAAAELHLRIHEWGLQRDSSAQH